MSLDEQAERHAAVIAGGADEIQALLKQMRAGRLPSRATIRQAALVLGHLSVEVTRAKSAGISDRVALELRRLNNAG